jgi:H+/gluconate symporter-like permease
MGTAFANVFLIILSGSILGQLYSASGAAASIAEGFSALFQKKGTSVHSQQVFGILIIFIVSGVLSIAGCSGFVCVLTVYPIALSMLQRLNLPRKNLPILAFAPTCFALIMPMSPQIYNTLPSRLMNVSPSSGFIPGMIAAALVEIGGFLYILYLFRKQQKRGETGFVSAEKDKIYFVERKLPPFLPSFIPLVIVFVGYNYFKLAIYAAVGIAALELLVMYAKYIGNGTAKSVFDILGTACRQAAVNAVNVATVAGFGAAVTKAPVFQSIVQDALASNANPLVIIGAVVAFLTGASGSATAGIQATLGQLGPLFTSQGISAAAIARTATVAASTLDTLPTHGVILTINELTGMTHKESYFPIAVVTVFLTTIATIIVIAMLTIFPWMA